jgi:enamine deaminase RidA (YjgF/YER057c/UK114 family)
MPVDIYTRKVQSKAATELYISAAPKDCVRTEGEIEKLFAGIREILKSENASILHERIFVIDGALDKVSEARRKAYCETDDGVAPSFLICRQGRYGAVSGVQVHAVAGLGRPEAIKVDGNACGRLVRAPGRIYVTLSAITGEQTSSHDIQAKEMLEKAESALRGLGSDFMCVPRPWMWLGDILSWYGQFNGIRNKFFAERGLIGKGSRQTMPASTGIGLALAGGRQCGMDLTAVLGPADSIEFLAAIGKQQCALDYGSAFSRASRATSPAGETVFVSGTASIDTTGATTHIGDARGQIETTIENVRAVLKDMKCSEKDIVQAIAYCKTAEEEKVFEKFKKQLDWPVLVVICDICRDDLLFEIEATAMPGAKQ